MSKKTTTSKSTKKKTESLFTHEQLREALLFLEDTMDRCVMQWFLTGQTARQCVYNTDLDVEEITGGVTIQTLNAGFSILKSVVPDLKLHCVPEESQLLSDSKYISFEHQGVPIKIQIIHNKYEVLKHLDVINYDVTSFNIPNPFGEYFNNRETYE